MRRLSMEHFRSDSCSLLPKRSTFRAKHIEMVLPFTLRSKIKSLCLTNNHRKSFIGAAEVKEFRAIMHSNFNWIQSWTTRWFPYSNKYPPASPGDIYCVHAKSAARKKPSLRDGFGNVRPRTRTGPLIKSQLLYPPNDWRLIGESAYVSLEKH